MAGKIEQMVFPIIEPITKKHNFELVDVEYVKEGPNWYLRIYIDKEGGITIDDCQEISNELSKELDKDDPIKQAYFLEVSSPGIDRPLKKDSDFIKHSGSEVEIRLFKAVAEKKQFEGELIGLVDNKIQIKIQNQINEFERENVSLVKRVIKFK